MLLVVVATGLVTFRRLYTTQLFLCKPFHASVERHGMELSNYVGIIGEFLQPEQNSGSFTLELVNASRIWRLL